MVHLVQLKEVHSVVPQQVLLVAPSEALLEELSEGPLVGLLQAQSVERQLEVQQLWLLPHRVVLIQPHHRYQR